MHKEGGRFRMQNRSINILWSSASPGDKDATIRWRRGDEPVLCETQPENLGKGFRLSSQYHPYRENNQVERFLYHFTLLRIDEPDPQSVEERGMVNFGRKASYETNPSVLSTGGQKCLKGCPCRLNIHIEESSFHLRILKSDRFDQAECIGTTDLRTVEVSDRLIPAPHTLEKGDALRELPVGGA